MNRKQFSKLEWFEEYTPEYNTCERFKEERRRDLKKREREMNWEYEKNWEEARKRELELMRKVLEREKEIKKAKRIAKSENKAKGNEEKVLI